jgi:Tfp pilus assembly protein PilZ
MRRAVAVRQRPQERRPSGRTAFSAVVQLAAPQGLFFGQAVNVGLSGMCVETDVPLPVGTELKLAFRLFNDEAEPLRARAQVAWVKPSNTPVIHRLGLTFCELGEEAARSLELFLSPPPQRISG